MKKTSSLNYADLHSYLHRDHSLLNKVRDFLRKLDNPDVNILLKEVDSHIETNALSVFENYNAEVIKQLSCLYEFQEVTGFDSPHDYERVKSTPVLWQYRHWNNEFTAVPGWSEWEEVKPFGLGVDVLEKVKELQHYIARGLKYELRALYAMPV